MTTLGMTGSRNGVTNSQRMFALARIRAAGTLHHGACVGADSECHRIAGLAGVPAVIHPPADERYMMPDDGYGERLPARPYHERNRDIVDAADEMIAFPDGPERPHGGTWYTIRYAVSSGVPVTVCYPDGTVEVR